MAGSCQQNHRRSSNGGVSLPVTFADAKKGIDRGDQDDQEGKANQLESTVNMVNGILGAGLLGMPFAFKSCGVVLGLVLLSLCLFTSRLSLHMLAQLGHATGLRSYEDLAQLAFGRTGTYAVNVCVILLNIGNIIAYMNIFVDTVLWFGHGWLFEDFEQAKNTLLTLTVVLGMLPVGISITSGKHMASLAYYAVSVYSVFCAYMTVRGLKSLMDPSQSASGSGAVGADGGPELVLWRPKGLIVAFPIMFYSFTAHNVIFPIYQNLKTPTLATMKAVTVSALTIVTTVYIVVGSSGYLMFRHLVKGDVLTNLGNDAATASMDDLLKFFYGSTSLATVPILLLPIKSCVFSTPVVRNFNRNTPLTMNKRGTLHCTVAVVTLGLALICGTLIPNIEFVFRLTGGSTCVTLGCILPSLIYLKLYHQVDRSSRGVGTKVSKRVLLGLAAFGLVSGVICTWSAVVDVDKADSEIRHHHHHLHDQAGNQFVVGVGREQVDASAIVGLHASVAPEEAGGANYAATGGLEAMLQAEAASGVAEEEEGGEGAMDETPDAEFGGGAGDIDAGAEEAGALVTAADDFVDLTSESAAGAAEAGPSLESEGEEEEGVGDEILDDHDDSGRREGEEAAMGEEAHEAAALGGAEDQAEEAALELGMEEDAGAL